MRSTINFSTFRKTIARTPTNYIFILLQTLLHSIKVARPLIGLMFIPPKQFKLYHPNLHRTNLFDTSYDSVNIGEIG